MLSGIKNEEREPLLGNVVFKNYSINSKESNDNNHFLIDEISACIEILERANSKAPFKDADLKRNYYRYRLLFLVMAVSGLIAIPGSLAYLLINLMNTHRQWQENLDQQKILNDKLDRVGSAEMRLDRYYGGLIHYASIKMELDYKVCEGLFENWHKNDGDIYKDKFYMTHVPAAVNNCIEWWDEQLVRQKLGDIFPEIKSLKRRDFNFMDVSYNCWFVDNNKTHPLQECEELARGICLKSTDHQMTSALVEQLFSDNEEADKPLDKQYDKYNNELDQLKSSASVLQESVASPFESLSNLNLLMLGISILSFIGILYLAYRAYQPRKIYKADTENQGNNIFRFFSSAGHHNKIAAISKRVNYELTPTTKIEPLLDHLKYKKMEIEKKRAQRMAFFAGMKDSNSEAYNHEFLNAELSRDVTKIIFNYAGFM